MMSVFAAIGMYALAALAEIAGCFAFWAWLRLDRSALWLIPGAISLALFAYLLTRVEVEFAGRLHDVWTNPAMSLQTKRELFQRMQIAHIDEHPHSMVRRSNMQGFDKKYEIKHRLHTSDTINNVQLASYGLNKGQKIPRGAFKTTDVIMHERMAARPFVPFSQFDVAQYVDYGRPKYDKNEDFRDSSGKLVDRQGARSQEMLGQVPAKKQRKQKRNKNMKRLMRAGGRGVVNYGLRAAFR